jgi:hypothetical protein
VLRHAELRAACDPDDATSTFIDTGLRLIETRNT